MADRIFKPDTGIAARDCMEPERLRDLQLAGLRETAAGIYAGVAFFRSRFRAAAFEPGDLKTFADLAALPLMGKNDLCRNYPYGLLAVPLKDIVRLHVPDETAGQPVITAYARRDLELRSELIERCFRCAGIGSGDLILDISGGSLFPGGFADDTAAASAGTAVIPAPAGDAARQLMLLRSLGATGICATPGYFNFLLEQAGELDLDPRPRPLRTGIFGAEPWTGEMRRRIETAAGIKAYDIYGRPEITGSGIGIECGNQCGMHVFEDRFYPEIIDPVTGRPLPDGSPGELVLTTLAASAMPLFRYRTGDITRIIAAPCACGRTLRRIERIASRTDDRFVIRGIGIFPSQIEAALLSVDGTLPHYNIVLYSENGRDEIEVDVEITEAVFSDKIRTLEALQHRLSDAVEQALGLRVKLKLVAPRTIQRNEGKTRRVFDHRREFGRRMLE
ncbi:MAG: phenylacetate--CoA ligase [Victivallales bacterium]|nr:phenylacetate--CoA ligase [Victivallales bacterium]